MIKSPPIPADGRILFFRRDRASFEFLSNFYPCPIKLDGETWPSVEHFFQAGKSHDPAYRREILIAPTAAKAKQLGAHPSSAYHARNSWFTRFHATPRSDWFVVNVDVMRQAIGAKYAQNADLKTLLLRTCPAQIIEDSPYDSFWGTGKNGTGLNWAGQITMETRQRLANDLSLQPAKILNP
jgi:N-glycosidase YbiA